MALGASWEKLTDTGAMWEQMRITRQDGKMGEGRIQLRALDYIRLDIFWKRLFWCYGAVIENIARITAYTAIITWIGTTLLARVVGVVAIYKVMGGGLCWMWLGSMMDASTETHCLA